MTNVDMVEERYGLIEGEHRLRMRLATQVIDQGRSRELPCCAILVDSDHGFAAAQFRLDEEACNAVLESNCYLSADVHGRT